MSEIDRPLWMNGLMQLSIIAENLYTNDNNIGIINEKRNILETINEKFDSDNNLSKLQLTSSSLLPYPDHSYAKHYSAMVVSLVAIDEIHSPPPMITTPVIMPPVVPVPDPIPSPPKNGISDSWEGSITRCICELQHDDGYMICCDRCSVWQHVDCMGVDRNNIPDMYLCELCEPRYVDKHHAIRCQTKKKEGPMLLQPRMDSSDSDSDDVVRSKNIKKRRTRKTFIVNNLNLKKDLQPKNVRPPRPLHDKNTNITSRQRSSSEQLLIPSQHKIAKLVNSRSRCDTPQHAFRPSIHHNLYTPELLKRLEGLKKLESHIDPLSFVTNNQDTLCPVNISMIQISPDIRAQGLEASCDIDTNSPIIEFTGNIMLRSQYQPSGSFSFIYFYSRPEFDLDVCIDASVHENQARFIRRSSKPNAEIHHFFDENGGLRFCLWSMHEILQGTEVTIPLEFQPQKNMINNRIHSPIQSPTLEPNCHILPNTESIKARKKSSDVNSAKIICEANKSNKLNSISPKQSDNESKPPKKQASHVNAKNSKLKSSNIMASKENNVKTKNSPEIKPEVKIENKKPFVLLKSETEKNLLVMKEKKDSKDVKERNSEGKDTKERDSSNSRFEKKHDRRLSTQVALLDDSKVNYDRSSSIDGTKMSREEKKLEAIMKAFERIEKKSERKCDKGSVKGTTSPKLNGRQEVIVKDVKATPQLIKKKTDAKKLSRSFFRLKKSKRSDESDQSDDASDFELVKKEIELKDSVFEEADDVDVPQWPVTPDVIKDEILVPNEIKVSPKTIRKPIVRKTSRASVKLKTPNSVSTKRYFKRSFSARTPKEVDNDDDRSVASEEGESALSRVHPNDPTSVPSTASVPTPIESNPSYTKKRWLRQAINEGREDAVSMDAEAHIRYDCTSPLTIGVSTPLKKRRLTVENPFECHFAARKIGAEELNVDPSDFNEIKSEKPSAMDGDAGGDNLARSKLNTSQTMEIKDSTISDCKDDIHSMLIPTLSELAVFEMNKDKIPEENKPVLESQSVQNNPTTTSNVDFPTFLFDSDQKILMPPISDLTTVYHDESYAGNEKQGQTINELTMYETMEASTPATKKKVSLLEYRQRMKGSLLPSRTDSEVEVTDLQVAVCPVPVSETDVVAETKSLEKQQDIGWSFEATAAERVLDKRLKMDSNHGPSSPDEMLASAPMSPPLVSTATSMPLNIPLVRLLEASSDASTIRHPNLTNHFASPHEQNVSTASGSQLACGRVEVVSDVMAVDSQLLLWQVDDQCRDLESISLKDGLQEISLPGKIVELAPAILKTLSFNENNQT